MSDWFYSLAPGRQEGPVDAEDLALLHADGQLRPESLVWREGMSAWLPWREAMAEVLPAGAAPPARAMSASGFAASPAAAPEDGAHRPYAVGERPASPYAPPRSRVAEQPADGPVHGHVVVYAGFWKRFAAWFIDSIVIGVASLVIAIPIGLVVAMAPTDDIESLLDSRAFDLLSQAVSWILSGWYFGWMYASRHQASLGKMAVGIKVVRGNGEALLFWRGFWRTFAQVLSGVLLLIGYIMAAFTARKQALHDIICDTVVVDRWAYTHHPQWQNERLGAVTVVILCLAALAAIGLAGMLVAVGVALTSGLA